MKNSNLGYQLSLFNSYASANNQVVNVASVPQRSPFRYAGGKTWLVPRIRQWLANLGWKPSIFIEPFAGGGIVGLTVAFENWADKVLLVELDEQVAAVWKTILSGNYEWLVKRIMSFDLTEKNLLIELEKQDTSIEQLAFNTILRNRTLHGGILARGSSFIKSGENGKGIRSRWYPETLARRIRNIASVRDKIDFIEGDGIAEICKYSKELKAAFFIDPPYSVAGKKAGKRLYKYHSLNHDNLFANTKLIKGDFLMTYDVSKEVETLAANNGFQTQKVIMKNTHHRCMTELIIGKNLDWAC